MNPFEGTGADVVKHATNQERDTTTILVSDEEPKKLLS
jgi:hypothetical protein